MPWPVAWIRPQTPDPLLRLVIRIVGAASLAFFGVAIIGVVAAIQAFTDPVDGWEDLIAALAIMIAVGAGVAGGLLSWWSHAASHHIGNGVWLGALAMAVVGATFWAPVAWMDHPTPLDRYVAAIRLALLVLGGFAWWRISRNQSRPA